MFLHLLPTPIEEAGATITLILAAGALIGGALWLLGGRFSRSLITLLSVAIGAFIGLRLPGWMGLSVRGSATAVGGALILGLSGFVWHRLWIGVGLALTLMLWMSVATWSAYGVGQLSDVIAPPHAAHTTNSLPQIWQALPPEVQRAGPFFCGIALVSALGMAILWPRAAMFTLYSLLGVTMITVLGISALELARPQMLSIVPTRGSSQAAVLAGMVLFGAIVQWRLTPTPIPKPVADALKKKADKAD